MPTAAAIKADAFRRSADKHVRGWLDSPSFLFTLGRFNRYTMQIVMEGWMFALRMQLRVPGTWLEHQAAQTILENALKVHPRVLVSESDLSAWGNAFTRGARPWTRQFHTIKFLDDTGRLLPKWLPLVVPSTILPPFNPSGIGSYSTEFAEKLNLIGGARPAVFNTRSAPLDTNSTVASIRINGFPLPLTEGVTDLAITTGVPTLELAAVAVSSYATVAITVDGVAYTEKVRITEGITVVGVVVTAEDKTETTYTVSVTWSP